MKTLLIIATILLASCSTPSMLTTPDKDDRLIIEVKQSHLFRQRYYYKVVDGYGKPAPRVWEYSDTLKKEGNILICQDGY